MLRYDLSMIKKYLEQPWRRLKVQSHSRVLFREIEGLLWRVEAMPTLDSRLPDEILGYDKDGLPH